MNSNFVNALMKMHEYDFATSSSRRAVARPGLWLGALLMFAGFGLLAPGYLLFQGTQFLIYALAILGLNLLVGYNGQLSLGHSAFYAVGAYTAAMLVEYAKVPSVGAVVIAGAVCFVVGFVFGFPASRLAGHYLALATFALSVATPQLLKHKSIEAWTGGAQGLAVDRAGAPWGLPLDSDQWCFAWVAMLCVALFMLARNLVNSRVGRTLQAIRDQPVAAQAMGINTTMHRAAIFGISALYVGIAGAMAGLLTQFVSPDSYSLTLSIALLVGVVLGGVARMSGPIWGALFILFAPNLLESVSKSAPGVLYGALLIGVILAMPSGIAGGFDRLVRQCRTAWLARQTLRSKQ